MGADKRICEEACAELIIGLMAGDCLVVGVVVAFEIGCRRVNEVTRGAATVFVLAEMES